jgi:biopolymer transport protein ExbD
MRAEQIIAIVLLCAATATASNEVIIDVKAEAGAALYLMNGARRDLAAIEALFKETRRRGLNQLVFIRPDDRVSFQNVLKLLEALRAAGVDQVELRANSGDESKDIWLSIKSSNWVRAPASAENPGPK